MGAYMTKEEAKQKLKKSGYNVIDDNSVVTVVIAPEMSIKNAIKDVKAKLNMWGYESSFGIKQLKGATEFETAEETQDETDADDIIDDSAVGINAATVDLADAENEKEEDDAIISKKKSSERKKTKTDKVDNKTDNVDSDSDSSSDNSAYFDEEDEYYDEEDSDMLLTEESIQFSLEDFGLDF